MEVYFPFSFHKLNPTSSTSLLSGENVILAVVGTLSPPKGDKKFPENKRCPLGTLIVQAQRASQSLSCLLFLGYNRESGIFKSGYKNM